MHESYRQKLTEECDYQVNFICMLDGPHESRVMYIKIAKNELVRVGCDERDRKI